MSPFIPNVSFKHRRNASSFLVRRPGSVEEATQSFHKRAVILPGAFGDILSKSVLTFPILRLSL